MIGIAGGMAGGISGVVAVYWPDGTESTVDDVTANQTITVTRLQENSARGH